MLNAIKTYLPLIFLVLVVSFLWSFEPLPPSSKNYSFTDYLLERYNGIYTARNWSWFIVPPLFLLLGGDPLRNLREMPVIGWIILVGSEVIIYYFLYWRYTIKKKRKK
jgi:hypothetical protein